MRVYFEPNTDQKYGEYLMTHEIDTLLDALARLSDGLTTQRADLEALAETFMPPEKWQEYITARTLAEENIAELGADTEAVRKILKEAVIESGESHERNGISAVFVSGRTKWNAKKLGNAVRMHPWLADFRSEGKPYVQIKGV